MLTSLRRLLAATAAVTATVALAPAASAGVTPTPTVTSRVDTIAIVGTDHRVYIKATGESGYRLLGGQVFDTPAIVAAPGIDYFIGVGSDKNLWIRTLAKNWAALGPAGTNCAGPSAVVSADTLGVACRGGDGAVWFGKTTLPTDGSLPKIGSFTSKNGITPYGPSIADAADYSVDTPTAAFTYYAVGTNHKVYSRNDADRPIFSLDDEGPCYSAFTVSEFDEGAACVTSDKSLLTYQVDVSSVGGSFKDRPAVSTDADFVTRFYGTGADNAVWTVSRDAEGTPSGFTRLGGLSLYGVAVANYSTTSTPTA